MDDQQASGKIRTGHIEGQSSGEEKLQAFEAAQASHRAHVRAQRNQEALTLSRDRAGLFPVACLAVAWVVVLILSRPASSQWRAPLDHGSGMQWHSL